METEFRNISKEKADIEAITVFAENLRQLSLDHHLVRDSTCYDPVQNRV